jgi:hypothetical protein
MAEKQLCLLTELKHPIGFSYESFEAKPKYFSFVGSCVRENVPLLFPPEGNSLYQTPVAEYGP